MVADTIRDFASGSGWWFWSRPGDQIVIDIEGVESFDALIANTLQTGRHTVITFSETDSLTLRNTWIAELQIDDFTFV